jgi:NADH:ubiquinone oxidoreductase subunit 4 (subunit M)
LLFLLAVVLPTDFLKRNISFALFIFLTVTASLTVLNFHIETQCNEAKCEHQGSIIYMPKLARLLSLFILIAIGLPVSSLFWNNFIIISALFKENFFIGSWVVLAITLAALVLLYELFVIRDLQKHQPQAEEMKDISATQFSFLSGILLILFLSFFNPLWFVL